MTTEDRLLDPVLLARRAGALAHCHNALVGLREAQARVTMLGTADEEGLLASMELNNSALGLHVGRLAQDLISDLERVSTLARGGHPDGVIARVG